MNSLISKHRKQLLAIAMLWVAFYHAYVGFSFKPINFVLVTCGYGGVDIFMFLSGFGLYYAHKKENNYLCFIKRRLLKILPYNIIVCIIEMFVYKRTILTTLINSFGLTLLFSAQLANWYTSFMIIIYLFTPLYLNIFKKKPQLVTIVSIVITFIVCLLANNNDFSYVWFRCAIYFLGIYFAYVYENNINLHEYLWIFLFFVGWMLMYYMYHNYGTFQHVYPLFLITPGLCIILSRLFEKITILNKPLDFLSKYTYQFYLIQSILVYIAYNNYEKIYFSLPVIGFDWFINIIIMIIALLLSILLVRFIEIIETNIINKMEASK